MTVTFRCEVENSSWCCQKSKTTFCNCECKVRSTSSKSGKNKIMEPVLNVQLKTNLAEVTETKAWKRQSLFGCEVDNTSWWSQKINTTFCNCGCKVRNTSSKSHKNKIMESLLDVKLKTHLEEVTKSCGNDCGVEGTSWCSQKSKTVHFAIVNVK